MHQKTILFLAFISTVLFLPGCKFTFEESEYLGTYTGELRSNSSLYQTCNAQAIVTDVGEELIDVELASDSNSTVYFTSLQVKRGISLVSHWLYVSTSALRIIFDRNTHYMSLTFYNGGSYYVYSFSGTRL